jgi:hypothetical protein
MDFPLSGVIKDQVLPPKECNHQQRGLSIKVSFNKTLPLTPWKFDYFGPDSAIQAFNPAHHPVVAKVKPTRVRLFTEVFNSKPFPMNECKHILYDGLYRSSILSLAGVTYTLDDTVSRYNVMEAWKGDELWVIDAHHMLKSCNVLITMAKATLKLKNNKTWVILGVDYSDRVGEIQHCSQVASVVGPENYRIAKRSIGINRKWSEDLHFPVRGSLMPQLNGSPPILHLPYPIRSDLSQSIAKVVRRQIPNATSPLEVTTRTVDVAHFFKRGEDRIYFDNLRSGINTVLTFLENMPLKTSEGIRSLKVFAGLAGRDKKNGRNQVFMHYVEMMLNSKIIIVSQRDAWTDHYRLMEALNSGAMVIADETLGLARGLRDGESLVIFTSFPDLREKLLYYLQHDDERQRIAKKGWEIAMGYHRSWHEMEGLVFGKPVTEMGDAAASFQHDLASP